MPYYLLLLLFLFSTCLDKNKNTSDGPDFNFEENISSFPLTIGAFPTPNNYNRILVEPHSFSKYLRNLPLKPQGFKVQYYNGKYKHNATVHAAVVDLPIGNKDLHQCADAIMRLRAEYLWNQKRYDQIKFNFTNGQEVAYAKWRQGYRIAVYGNKSSWIKKGNPSDSYNDFWSYLETIFMYAGTASLEKELEPVDLSNMKIGDIFIQGGYPGHAVIVVDMAYQPGTGNKIFMLAQSYMPAQELHVLQNPGNSALSPWFSTSFKKELKTPEWVFLKSDLKRFP
jgi:hypothetical protein